MTRDLRVGDRVIIKDRRPGWKFCMPYEPGVWTVTGVSGTMVTAEKGRNRVSQNISWFREATFADFYEEPDGDDYIPNWSSAGVPGRDCETGSPQAAEQNSFRVPASDVPMASDVEGRSQSGKYNLRPNLPPHQRLKDFACNLKL
ncbi:hypothetical protein NDU88_001925 [Pleurodeles waltl]|uniref:Uncharacterized protein n=1 Tax=Pleurodeles waltl TaxID=8319 RepID=A0AAV7WNS0_PLEWA|nr:hypothetical protein NDU88_001925 [Pleurodeles waltl]